LFDKFTAPSCEAMRRKALYKDYISSFSKPSKLSECIFLLSFR
jgi:hypothetical protein